MAQNTPQHARNWEIWRRYKFQGARRCDLAREYGVNPGRIDQIVRKHERMALWATKRILKRKDDETLQRLPDHYRDGLLGVEYVFTADRERSWRLPDEDADTGPVYRVEIPLPK